MVRVEMAVVVNSGDGGEADVSQLTVGRFHMCSPHAKHRGQIRREERYDLKPWTYKMDR